MRHPSMSLRTVACQAHLSTGFSRQEHWSWLPCPSPGIEPTSLMVPALASGFFTTSATWEPLHLSSLLQTPNDCRMVDIEFFSDFLCICKKISFSDSLSWSLSTSNDQPLLSSSSRLLSPLQNFLNLRCTLCLLAVHGPNVLLILWVVSAALLPILNSNKKIAQICFWSNIISLV